MNEPALNVTCTDCLLAIRADTPTGFVAPGTGDPVKMKVGTCTVYGWVPAHVCEKIAA